MTLDRYLQHRRYWEIALWFLLLATGLLANIAVELIEIDRSDSSLPLWEPVVWESTSTLVIALLIPLVLLFDRRFPVDTRRWQQNLLAHALFTIVFSLLHVGLMYWARVGIYLIVGDNSGYDWPDWWGDFRYEYLKDFRSYALLVSVIYLYRFVLRRLQGEAGYLSEKLDAPDPVAVTDRFLIKKLGREFLVRVSDIDWIESSGNYVNLHAGDRVYPLRETMKGITERLQAQGFQRVHRGAVVNLDRIAEIVSYDSGDGEARLTNNAVVPVSRRFRKELRDALGPTST